MKKLRKILEKEQGRALTIEEAKDIGDHLVSFYTALAGNYKVTKGGLKNKKNTKWRMVDRTENNRGGIAK